MTSFTVNEENVEAVVYKQTGQPDAPVYLVKVSFLEIGTYISGIRVQKSPKFPDSDMWVQLPGYYVMGRFYKTIECSKDSEFLTIVTRKAQDAVADYRALGNDVDLLADVPF